MQQAVNRATGRGIRQAARELQMPRGGPRKDFNGYAYIAYLPTPPAREEIERHERVLDAVIPAFRQRWDQEFVPKLERDLATMRAFDLSAADGPTLAGYLRQALDLHQGHYHIHFLVIFTLFGATARLARLYERVTGSSHQVSPYRLLQGIPNISVQAGKALHAIAAEARTDPAIVALFETSDPHSILRRLRRTPAAESLLARFQAYLETYGNRSVAEDISGPTWIEDPSYPLLALRGYVQGAPRDFDEELTAQAKEAERATQQALSAIPAQDESLRREFLDVLAQCRALWPLREDHAHFIDQQSVALVRRVLLACGARLAEVGVIDHRDDVFYLNLEEVLEALESGGGRLMDRVQEREAVRKELMRTAPPQFLGTMPAQGPAMDSELAKFFNPMGVSSNPVGEQAKTLRGLAGSPGVHTGPARVVLSTGEFDRVQPGDVLVTRTTNPSWTPLFGVIGALVTDSGGVLSHGAIVAREVGLPAVMGAKGATARITDGQIVTVDGNAGVVRLA
jgi:pyruvate,water dikinase